MTWTVGTLEKKQKREREENPETLPSVDDKKVSKASKVEFRVSLPS